MDTQLGQRRYGHVATMIVLLVLSVGLTSARSLPALFQGELQTPVGLDDERLLQQTSNICLQEEVSMYNCLYDSNFFFSVECEACISEAFPDNPTYCNEFGGSLCPALLSCPCSGCQDEIQTFLSCGITSKTQCGGLACPLASEEIGSTVEFCEPKHQRMNSCLAGLRDGGQCEACIVDANPHADSPCNEWTSNVCGAILTDCPTCGDCRADIQEYYNCILPSVTDHSCELDCHMCPSERLSYIQCMATNALDRDSCSRCVGAVFPEAESNCRAFENNLCEALDETCLQKCGACASTMKSYMACTIASQRPDCRNTAALHCGNDPPTVPPTKSPTIVPTKAPTTRPTKLKNKSPTDPASSPAKYGGVCGTERTSLDDCLLVHGTSSAFSTECSSCVDDSFQDVIFTCSSLRAIVCPSLRRCECGTCTLQVGEYYDCIVDNAAYGCESSCTFEQHNTDIDLSRGGSDACAFEKTEMNTCIDAFVDDRVECQTCLSKVHGKVASGGGETPFASSGSSLTDVFSCPSIQSSVCGAVETCPCDTCRLEIDRYYTCEAHSSHDCSIACDIGALKSPASASLSIDRPSPVVLVLLLLGIFG